MNEFKNNSPPKNNSFCEEIISQEDINAILETQGSMYPYCRSNDMLCIIKKLKDSIVKYPISKYFIVKLKYKDLRTGKYRYVIEAFEKDSSPTFELSGECLTVQGLKELLMYDVLYNEQYAKELQKYIMMSAIKADIVNSYSHLGWFDDETFLTSNCYSTKGINSKYIGKIDLQQKGSKEAYLNMIRKNVLPYKQLLFVWILGFSSVILSYLNRTYDFGCPIFEICNASSKGKTTAAMLATSVCSNPSLDKGFITSLSSTSNALIEYVATANGHTVALDELGCNMNDETRLLYELSSGRSKKRLDSNSQLKDTVRYDSVILLTGEYSAIKDNAENGIRARVFELTDNMTVSAEHSNRIKQTVLCNYGVLYDDYIKYVVGHTDSIIKIYNSACKKLKDEYKRKKGDLTYRIIEKLSVVYVTAVLVKECLPVEIELSAIQEYIYSITEKSSTDNDIADNALDLIMQYVASHSAQFSGDSNIIEGRFEKINGKIYVLKSVVERELIKAGYENPTAIYKQWISKKLTIGYPDRLYKKITINGTNNIPCIVFNAEQCKDVSSAHEVDTVDIDFSE